MTTPIVQGLPAVTIHVKSIAKAKEFYTKVVGLKDVSAKSDEIVKGASFEIPGTSTKLSMHEPFPNDPGRPPGTVSGIIFGVPNVQNAVTEITKRGGKITDAPTDAPWGGKLAVFADVDGNEFVITGP